MENNTNIELVLKYFGSDTRISPDDHRVALPIPTSKLNQILKDDPAHFGILTSFTSGMFDAYEITSYDNIHDLNLCAAIADMLNESTLGVISDYIEQYSNITPLELANIMSQCDELIAGNNKIDHHLYRHEDLCENLAILPITADDLSLMLSAEKPHVPQGHFYVQEKDGQFIAVDNALGKVVTETFPNKECAQLWLQGSASPEELRKDQGISTPQNVNTTHERQNHKSSKVFHPSYKQEKTSAVVTPAKDATKATKSANDRAALTVKNVFAPTQEPQTKGGIL